MSEIFEVTTEWCEALIATKVGILDASDPEWRKKLGCCLRCSDLSPENMKHLESLNTAAWLAYGKDYRMFKGDSDG